MGGVGPWDWKLESKGNWEQLLRGKVRETFLRGAEGHNLDNVQTPRIKMIKTKLIRNK